MCLSDYIHTQCVGGSRTLQDLTPATLLSLVSMDDWITFPVTTKVGGNITIPVGQVSDVVHPFCDSHSSEIHGDLQVPQQGSGLWWQDHQDESMLA